jgi:predicted transcriptional regulator
MKFNVLVKEVMAKSIRSINADDPIVKAAKLMKKYRVGSVLVMSGKKVVGILSTRDIVYKHTALCKGRIAKDIMSNDLVKISPNKTIEEAARLMVSKRIEKLPVFDKDKLLGIITNNDILKVEPALFDTLLERMKMGAPRTRTGAEGFIQCEACGNYSDDVKEIDGVYMCEECRD